MDRRAFITGGAKASAGLVALQAAALANNGGPVLFASSSALQDDRLRLNHNANPLGIPPRARAAMLDAMTDVPHYPGPRRQILVARIAELHGLTPEHVVLGCGSTEIIRMAIEAHASPESRILQAIPTYENAVSYAAALPVPGRAGAVDQ